MKKVIIVGTKHAASSVCMTELLEDINGTVEDLEFKISPQFEDLKYFKPEKIHPKHQKRNKHRFNR